MKVLVISDDPKAAITEYTQFALVALKDLGNDVVAISNNVTTGGELNVLVALQLGLKRSSDEVERQLQVAGKEYKTKILGELRSRVQALEDDIKEPLIKEPLLDRLMKGPAFPHLRSTPPPQQSQPKGQYHKYRR